MAGRGLKGSGFLISFALFFGLCVFTAYGAPEWPADTGIMAEAGIAMDENSGTVLFGQNIHQPYAPASITKLLTALVVAENASLDEPVTFSHDAVYDVESGSGNSLALEEGDVLTVRDCLYALLLRSSNQAANALAEHVGGSMDGFVEMMNERIARLGCTESHFANPSGLNDEEQYVTAYDMALIAREAFANETVLEISSARTYKLPATIKNPDGLSISMEHRLLTTESPSSQFYLEGAVAGKTGYTSLAGNTLVTYAIRGDRGVISVILKGTQPQYYLDGKALIEFGFSSFQNIGIAGQETFLRGIEGIDVGGDLYLPSELYLEEDAVVTVPIGASFADVSMTSTTEFGDEHPDTALALLEYTYNERKVGSAYICARSFHVPAEPLPLTLAEEETEQSQEPSQSAEETPSASRGWGAATAVAVVLILLAGTIFLLWQYRKKKEREAAARRRERRLQRLAELGYSEEDFERLVDERRRSGGGKKR